VDWYRGWRDHLGFAAVDACEPTGADVSATPIGGREAIAASSPLDDEKTLNDERTR
jgi:hypothetical protein